MNNSSGNYVQNDNWSLLMGNLQKKRVICSNFVFVFLNVPLKPSL